MGKFCVEDRKVAGRLLVDFAERMEITVVKTFLQ